MNMKLVDEITSKQIRRDLPEFRVGDTVKVNVTIREGQKTRIQAYEGLVIARKNSGVKETFTVRKISSGVGVERTFLLNSPLIDSIVVTKKGKVRRAKLYYIRNLSGKAARIKERGSLNSGVV